MAEAGAQLRKDMDIDTSSNHAEIQTSNAHLIWHYPTSIHTPSYTSASAATTLATEKPMIQFRTDEDLIRATSINAGDLVHAVWHDDLPGNFEILYKRDGADFDPTTINLSNNAGVSESPAIAAVGNNVHVVWTDSTPGIKDIFYRRSTDGGATFGPTINLSNNAGFSGDPAITVSGNNVHVVWEDDTPGNFEILYRRSTDGGASFTEPTKNLSGNAGVSAFPAIAASGNNLHVVWQDTTTGNNDILYRRSTNGGSTFPNIIKNLSDNPGISEFPAIAASGNNVHVVWGDGNPGNFDILYRRSQDGGTTFPNIIKNLSDNDEGSFSPVIVVLGNNVHVVWEDDTPGISDIFYTRSLDGGTTFPNVAKNLSSSNGDSFAAAIALSDNNVYVVWSDNTLGNDEIIYRTSANNGATFPPTLTNLSANGVNSESPTIAVS